MQMMTERSYYDNWHVEFDSDTFHPKKSLGYFPNKEDAIQTAKHLSSVLPEYEFIVIKMKAIRVVYQNGKIVSEHVEQPYGDYIVDW